MKLLTMLLASSSLVACAGRSASPAGPDDGRAPELGGDLSIVMKSKITLPSALVQAEQTGPVIEAKFELADDGHSLSLSTYPIGAPLAMDAERSKFEELSGDPTASPWQPSLEQFHDFEHLTRSARDLTLVQLSPTSLREAIVPTDSDSAGFVYWAVPTVHEGRAGYGVFTYGEGANTYAFVDGGGPSTRQVLALGAGPGSEATDARAPELNDHPEIVRTSQIALADAIAQVEAKYGPAVEAKFEMADDGVSLSLSVYPASDLSLPAEKNTLSEASGDPTAAAWSPDLAKFDVPDEEHVTRAARDLTLVQTASLSLHDAVLAAQGQIQGGIAYWAIPTIRSGRAGYGVYVLAPDNTSHYFFVS